MQICEQRYPLPAEFQANAEDFACHDWEPPSFKAMQLPRSCCFAFFLSITKKKQRKKEMECHQPDNVFEYVQHQLFLQCHWFDKGPLDNPKCLDSQ